MTGLPCAVALVAASFTQLRHHITVAVLDNPPSMISSPAYHFFAFPVKESLHVMNEP